VGWGNFVENMAKKFINLCVLSLMAQQGQKMAAEAAGASAGAWQQNPAVCAKINELIRDMRSDGFLAIRMDEFVRWLNKYVDAVADDVKECLRHDTTVKIVRTKNAEVMWLWESWNYYELVEKVADMAARYRSVLAEPENPDEYDDDCGMLGCDKGDDDAQVDDWE